MNAGSWRARPQARKPQTPSVENDPQRESERVSIDED